MKTLSSLLLAVAGLVACTSAGSHGHTIEQSDARAMSVIPLQYAFAAQVAEALNGLQPQTRVVADQRTNSVIVACASDADLSQVRECISQLDVPAKGTK